MVLTNGRLYRYKRTALYIAAAVFLALTCSVAVWAEEESGGDSWLFVNGCSIAEGSVVSPTEVFTFAFGNNVVNVSVREYNSTKFSLEMADGSSVGITVDMADDQIEPDRRWYITVIPETELAPGSYCLTAYAGICAKNGKITENDFKVNFTVEGEETPSPVPTPEETPTPDPGFLSETTPSPMPSDSVSDFTQAPNPSLAPYVESGDYNNAGLEQNPTVTPGTGGENTAAVEQPPTEAGGEPQQTTAAGKSKKKGRKTKKSHEKLSANETDSKNQADGTSRQVTAMKIKLGKEKGKIRISPQQKAYRGGILPADLYKSTVYRTGGAPVVILLLLFGAGIITRIIGFYREIV